ncbi:SDR family NAD(P)-dependent oxidoreductase [uncultured Brevibacillus sp.]|uniref:SDR family NAD(P)-dependent oxidoreductase n=1 Tax=uncultured Brevibacillus sp. TaxID=169970 RepID=UPI00259838CD|nr:SDR family NAD(P)-dependent oxidoreductase [uncultured Brevibacillus sp.]
MNILVTGATGFLGKKLSQDLVNEGHTLFLLARNEQKASQLLQSFADKVKSKIHMVMGDVSLPGLGLTQQDLQLVQHKIDAVYHLAAYLSFDPAHKTQTFTVNVDGTKNTLLFAEGIGASRFIYVSTAYTVGKEVAGKEELYSPERSFVNHYEESKCLAEHLVISHSDKMEVVIVRPSIIIGDSRTGEADTNFGLYGLLKGLCVLKRRASRTAGWQNQTYRMRLDVNVQTNLVPVDYVTSVLVAALTHAQNKTIYHASNPAPPTQELVIECIKEVLDFPNLQAIPYESNEPLTVEEKVFHASMGIFKEYFTRTLHFPTDNTKGLLRKVNRSELTMDKTLLTSIMRGYQKQPVLT